jgi:3-oxoacyl-[acyl-carrier protein] reductase
MIGNLSGKVALVTGASDGIGAAIARELGRNGATVAVNYLSNKAQAERVVADIRHNGGNGLAVQSNVQQQDSVHNMLEEVGEKLGAIDVLVLSYGPPAFWTRFVDQEQDAFEEKLLAEIRSFFIVGKAVAADMAARGSGCIIGLSSVLARNTSEGFSAHAIAKSGVEAMLRSMALELAPAGVRVNTVAPSLSQTPGSSWVPDEGVEQTIAHTPLGRLCTPEDVAKAVVMVASDDAEFICGAYMPVNGGLLLG